MKTILSRMTPKQIFLIIISVILISASVVADLLQPYFFSEVNLLLQNEVMNYISEGYSTSEAFKYIFPDTGRLVGIMIGLAAGGIVCNILSILISINVSINIATKVRIDTYSRIQYLSLQDVEKFSTSSLISRLNSDIYQIQTMLIMLFNILIKTPIYIIGGFTLSLIQIINLSEVHKIAGGSYIAFAYLLVPLMIVFAAIFGTKSSKYIDIARGWFDKNNKIWLKT